MLANGQPGLLISHNSSLINCTAFDDSERGGGAIAIDGGFVTIAANSSIIDATSAANGGAISMKGGTTMITGGSFIIDCGAEKDGGAVAVDGGILIFNGAFIGRTLAASYGGVVSATGGE
eukprot:6290623-Prymnesium_polylepis.1